MRWVYSLTEGGNILRATGVFTKPVERRCIEYK